MLTSTSVCIFELQSQPGVRGLVITPKNIHHYASFIHSSVSIQNRLIHVGQGNPEVEVIKISLDKIRPGAHSAIKVTVGLKPGPANVDSDPTIELSDGTKYNRFTILDPGNFPEVSPCFASGGSHDNTLVPPDSKQASIYQIIFEPDQSYGACTAGYGNGYINTAQFTDRLDLSKELSFVVRKAVDSAEEYDFYYFILEVL